jgi:creatinine amidohydrolase/Fe(II)-dependent formamide hydrolase-like protein
MGPGFLMSMGFSRWNRALGLALPALWAGLLSPSALRGQASSPDPESVRPIDAFDSVWIEELTWMEVRDALRSGKTTALIVTGGVEQNGPYLATGKHSIILEATAEAIARKLGNALVAPIVSFVPEGDFDPPSGHMRYPGTISVRQETFRALLADIATSMKAHGFTEIVLMGDSGGNQDGMEAVAGALSPEWEGSGTRIHFIPEYYDNPRWAEWLRSQGVVEVDEGLHDDVRHSAIMMLVDPNSVRAEERRDAGLFRINGVELDPMEETLALARRLVEYQAEVTVEAIRKAIGG